MHRYRCTSRTCGRTQGISSAPPISRAVPLESEQDRTVYKYIISGGSQSDIFAKAHARGVEAPSESVHSQHQGESRPDSARRPYSSQSTRLAHHKTRLNSRYDWTKQARKLRTNGGLSHLHTLLSFETTANFQFGSRRIYPGPWPF